MDEAMLIIGGGVAGINAALDAASTKIRRWRRHRDVFNAIWNGSWVEMARDISTSFRRTIYSSIFG